VSDLKPDPISAETGTAGAGVAASDMSAPVTVTAAAEVESPRLAPEQEETSPKADTAKADAPKAEMPKAEMPKAEPFKFDAPKVDAPKVEVPKVDAVKPEAPHLPGKLMIMSAGERVGADAKVEAASGEGSSGKRRMSAMAAVVALATVAGALGGALATAGFGHLMSGDAAAANSSALEASIARIDADIVALKAGVEHTSKVATGQFNKTSDRLDKVEKAQAEPAAKLAKLSEAVDKLRAAPAPVAAAAPVPAKEVTGSVPQPAAVAAAAAAPPKPDVGRLPRVEGWVLRDVANGGALIEGRQGVFEVYAGDPIPGLGRVDAIRKQDGKWVVVTSKGLISR
jgi:hypothetical protein